MPLSRAGAPLAARTGLELLQYLFQSARGAHIAHLLAARPDEALRSPALDDFGEAGMVRGGISADDFTLQADHHCAGEAVASGGWPAVPGRMFGARGEKALTTKVTKVHEVEPEHRNLCDIAGTGFLFVSYVQHENACLPDCGGLASCCLRNCANAGTSGAS